MYRLSSIIFVLFVSMQIFAQSPHGDELKADCAQCHTSESWSIDMETIKFDHNILTEFKLEGTHSKINCTECHSTLVFNEVQPQCISCHTDIHSASIGNDCTRCHTAENWIVNNIPELHEENGFALIGEHASLDCIECHTSETNLRFNRIGNECINCHDSTYSETVNPDHVSAGFSKDCVLCHDALSKEWSDGNFNHEFFSLTLGHDIQDCTLCHVDNNYINLSSDCVSCHQNDFNNSVNPNHQNAAFSTDCISCHTTNPDWNPTNWDHNDFYPLNGAHAALSSDCASCHKEEYGNYSNTPNTCVGCHIEDFNSTSDPNHSISNFPTDCTTCHTEDSWTPSTFNHDFFPLTLGHDTQNCTECHTTANFADTSAECASCHQNDYDATTNPNHLGAQFSTDCTTCHTTGGWTPSTFDHEFFSLTLGHDIEDCNQCHINNNYTDLSSECVTCHQNDFNNSVNPNHQNAAFSTDCTSCHTTNPDWNPANWDHNDFYPLNGAHAALSSDCVLCHKDEYGAYSNTPNTCVGCHIEDFNSTSDPNHSISNFPTDCTVCHTEDSWTPSTFNHDFFPLTLAHDIQSCTECHTTANYADTSPECVSCHQSNYDATTNPNHLSAQFSTDCTACHTTGGWVPSTFDHNFFPLTLGHDIQDCNQCHTTASYADTSPECVSCHQSNYDATTNPNHLTAQFTTDCAACHTTGGWVPSTFDHNFFPLTQGHDIQDCTQCHTTGSYYDASPECVSCHQSNYDATTNPNHLTAQFTTDCAACHTPGGWVPSTFDHNFFPLTQGHDIQDCTQCHTTGSYYDATPECVSCHLSDYNATTDPNHLAAQFTTDCTVCHTIGGWIPSTFDHDGQYFPIYSGKHQGEWNQCIDCHTIANNYSSFSCIDCHEHNNKANVDDSHSGVNGYVYESNACYQCHPNGEE